MIHKEYQKIPLRGLVVVTYYQYLPSWKNKNDIKENLLFQKWLISVVQGGAMFKMLKHFGAKLDIFEFSYVQKI